MPLIQQSSTALQRQKLLFYFQNEVKEKSFLPLISLENVNQILSQLDEIESKYQSYLKTRCLAYRCFHKYFFWRNSVHSTYKRVLNEIAVKIAQSNANDLNNSLFCKHFLKTRRHREFFGKVHSIMLQNIYNCKNPKGYGWKIVNKHGVTNYLIGTIHIGTKSMLHTPIIEEALKKCHKFFGENVTFAGKKIYYKNLTNSETRPFDHVMDNYIIYKNKNCYSLDTRTLRKKCELLAKNEANRSVRVFFDNNFFSLYLKSLSSSETNSTLISKKNAPPLKKLETERIRNLYARIVKGWQDGDERWMEEISRGDLAVQLRNESWLQRSFEYFNSGENDKKLPGLIEQLTNAKQPVGIAVGVGHCLDECGLVNAFKKAGFEVTRY